jgi:hypothetical protein
MSKNGRVTYVRMREWQRGWEREREREKEKRYRMREEREEIMSEKEGGRRIKRES